MIDPMEKKLEGFLKSRRVNFSRDDKNSGLDFLLPEFGIYIEVKQFHSPRIAEQMSRVRSVIAIQGMDALEAFVQLCGDAECPVCGFRYDLKPRSLQQLRLYWKMLQFVCEHAETPAFQGSDGAYNLHQAVKVAMGYVKPIYNLQGKVTGYRADSIAFHKMPPDRFAAYFDKAQSFIFEHVVPRVQKESFEQELCELLRIFR